MNIINYKEKGCPQCNTEYQCFDCECFEVQWLKGYTLQDNLTWEKESEDE